MSRNSSKLEVIHRSSSLRHRLLRRQAIAAMIVAAIFFPVSLLRMVEFGFQPINAIHLLIFLALVVIVLRERGEQPKAKAFAVTVVMLVILVVGVGNYGLLSPVQLLAPFVVIFASVLFGQRVALRFFGVAALSLAILAALFLGGILRYQVDVRVYAHSWTSWVVLLVAQAGIALWYLFLVAPINAAERQVSEHLEAVLAGINDALFIHDKGSGAIVQVNDTTCTMYGYSEEQLLRLSVGELSAGTAPYAQSDAQAWMDKAFREGPQLFEWQAKDRTGNLFWVEVNMRGAHLNGTERLLVLVRDISARKQAENELRQVQANLSALIESTNDLIWSVDLNHRYVTFNGNAQEHIRQVYGTALYVGVSPHEIMPTERAVFWTRLYAKALQEGSFRENLVLRDDKILSLSLSPVTIDGEQVGVSVFGQDITDRARAEAALRESQQKTRAIFDLSYGFVGLLTPEGRLIDVNQTALDFVGATLSAVKGQLFWETPWWSHSSNAQEAIRTAVIRAASGEIVQSEAIHLATDGSVHTIQFTLRPVKDETGRIVALIPEGRDVTEERAARAELSASNQKFLKLFHSSPDAIVVTRLNDGRIVEVNTAFESFSGFARTELLGRPVSELQMYGETDRARFVSVLKQDQSLRDAEFTLTRKSGKESLVLASAELIEVDGEPHAITILHDISERKRAELALRESEARFNTAFQFMPVGAGITTLREGRFIAANRHFEDVFGYKESELLGHTTSEFGIWANQEDRAHVVSMIQKGQAIHAYEVQIRRKDGSLGWASYAGVRVVLDGEEYLLSGAVDITARKQAEALLRESEARYRALFDRSLDLVYINDLEGNFIDANDAALHRLGYTRSDIRQLSYASLLSEDQLPLAFGALHEIQQTGTQSTLTEFRLKHRDGTSVYVETKGSAILSNGKCVAIQSVARDITERKSLEEQLRQSQKMEAIGSLAGGVAHDFNNLLAVILNHAELAMDSVTEVGSAKDDLLEIMKASDRAAGLTRQLLAFSRKQILNPQLLNLNEVAAGLEKMLRRILGEDIEYVQVLAANLGVVRADPGQVEQVLMNLAVNARDAMPDGGKLTIETANVELDHDYSECHMAVKPGPFVMIAVADTGIGMDEVTRTRIFEPFFTTKGKGKGTGLGLSTVYGIVKQSGGNLWVYSEPGQGTTFKIFLPCKLSAAATVAKARVGAPAVSSGAETILVVEDERALRDVMQRILGSAGYTVMVAADGDQALKMNAEYAAPIHLLLTDVVMPGMSGRVLAEQLMQTRPTMKVIYMSGYTDDAIVHRGVLDAGMHFINKPMSVSDLTRKIREVLDS